MEELTERYVLPFYLHMMGLNAWTSGAQHVDAIRALGPTLDADGVVRLLSSEWRQRVMGAWFALFHPPSAVGDEVLRSLGTSAGSLTAPPLATVAAALMGAGAIPALEAYAATEVAARDGSGRFAAAVIEHLDAASMHGSVDQRDREAVAAMLAIADHLRSE